MFEEVIYGQKGDSHRSRCTGGWSAVLLFFYSSSTATIAGRFKRPIPSVVHNRESALDVA